MIANEHAHPGDGMFAPPCFLFLRQLRARLRLGHRNDQAGNEHRNERECAHPTRINGTPTGHGDIQSTRKNGSSLRRHSGAGHGKNPKLTSGAPRRAARADSSTGLRVFLRTSRQRRKAPRTPCKRRKQFRDEQDRSPDRSTAHAVANLPRASLVSCLQPNRRAGTVAPAVCASGARVQAVSMRRQESSPCSAA
ncbi:hypothetical protein QLQ15_03350 [Lysobacter sp. LF1]|uniref:Uncharacterized protein n=1 Tax=Lysobacter stagni TaxID=3045172 RepID=A0ABT6XCS6_9GAMM|nr:hypothetical protein [Lysobacter sp. LF1]MDI9237940.1 hypothetical protein [Lysobacter sp. LF1]